MLTFATAAGLANVSIEAMSLVCFLYSSLVMVLPP